MLDYQVKYWSNQEQRRSNLANEAIKRQANELQAESNRLTALDVQTRQRQADIAAATLDNQKYIAQQQAITNRYNAETSRALAKSQIVSNGYNNVLTQLKGVNTTADTAYKQAQTETQKATTPKVKAEAVKTALEGKKTELDMKLRVPESLSNTAKNLAGAYQSIMKPANDLINSVVEIVPF